MAGNVARYSFKVGRKPIATLKKLHQQALQEKYRETEAFLEQIPARIQKEGLQNLTHWLEQSLRTAIHADARRMVENLLNDRSLVPEAAPCHEFETIYRNRTRPVQTLFGTIRITRNYHHHTKTGNGRCPLDDELELTGPTHPR